MTDELKPNIDEAIEFLQKYHPTGPWILCASNASKQGMETRNFQPHETEALRAWIMSYSGVCNFYFHVNTTINPGLTSKAKKNDIKQADWIHVDIDPTGSSLEEILADRRRIEQRVQNLPTDLPPATVILDSGGGYQLFWRLASPYPVNGDEGMCAQFERYNRNMAERLGGDGMTHNIDRIMRLPGTINVPTATKLKKGRVPTLARLIRFGEETHELTAFKQAQERAAPENTSESTNSVKVDVPSGDVQRYDIEDLNKYGIDDAHKAIIVSGKNPDGFSHQPGDGSRSSWLFKVVGEMVRRQVPDEMIYSIITDPNYAISESVLETGSKARVYAMRQIRRCKENSIEPHLMKLNDKHAVIGNIGGKCKVIEEVYDPALRRSRLTKQSFDDFRNRYMNQKVKISSSNPDEPDTYMQLGKWWLAHPHRRYYDTIGFMPGQDVPNVYNLWRGFAKESVPGDCSLFLEHMRENICGGIEEHYQYLIKWMAHAVQSPDSAGQTAVVLRGRMGVGKGFFSKTFGALWGRHYLQITDPKHLVGSFNAHLRDCVVLFADEAFYAGDKKHESILKALVTEENLVVEAKGVDAEASPNYTHIIMASNSAWVVPAGQDDRRYFVLDVADHKRIDTDYFQRMQEQLDNGGYEALLHHLSTLDLEGFQIRAAPKTSALMEQKILSLSPEEEWWYTKLTDGRVLGEDDHWKQEVIRDQLMDDYVIYMQRTGVYRRATQTALSKFLERILPAGFPVVSQQYKEVKYQGNDGWSETKSKLVHVLDLPSLSECRDYWDYCYGSGTKWAEQGEIRFEERVSDDAPSPF